MLWEVSATPETKKTARGGAEVSETLKAFFATLYGAAAGVESN